MVQMPLFAFVSGWVFSIPTGENGRFGEALGRKIVRLALPMASVSLLYFAIDTLRGRTEGIGVVDVLITPYQHLWYLQASLWLVLVGSLGLLIGRGREVPVVTGLLALSVLPFLAAPQFAFDLLAAEQATYLAPFFLAGLLANRIGVEREARASGARLAAALGGLTAVCGGMAIVTCFLVSTTPAEDMPTHTTPALLLGIAFASLLMLLRPQSRLLESLGERSLTIYLFHVFIAAPAREVLLKVWPGVPTAVLFVVAFSAGVVVPWFLHDAIRRFRWSAGLFLGDLSFGGRR
jgi:fucose 4-O-acetylase-like acetyltransferase